MRTIVKKVHWELPRDNLSPFNIYSYGLNEKMEPGIVRYGTTEHDWLFIFFNDDVYVDLGRGLEPVPQDSLVIWSPNDNHCYGNKSNYWRHSWIHVAGKRVKTILKESKFSPLTPVKVPAQFLIETYFLQIFNEISLNQYSDSRILKNLFECWLLEMSRIAYSKKINKISEPMIRLKRYIDMNLSKKISLSEMADVARLSVPHMCAEFRRTYGDAPLRYLIGQRVKLAMHLLQNRKLSISEIADEIGYSNIFQFSKMFKKLIGVSPKKYRSQNK